MKKDHAIMFLSMAKGQGFEVIKSNHGQIVLNNRESTNPFICMNDIGYLTPLPYAWSLIDDEIKRWEEMPE